MFQGFGVQRFCRFGGGWGVRALLVLGVWG